MTRLNTNSILGTSSILAAAMSAALAGCVGSVDVGDNQDAPTWEEFRTNTYQEPWENGAFVVNGDETIADEKKLEEYYNSVYGNAGSLIVNQEAEVDTVWDNVQKLNLTYCISDDFQQLTNADGTVTAKDVILAAMQGATADWAQAADVQFEYLAGEDANCNAGNNNVLFDVGMVQGQPYLARAFFPGEDRLLRNVLVDTSSFNNLGELTVQGIMAHELGHVLGFRHEHTRDEAGGVCFEDNNWRPLTDYDQLSVMHYPQCNGVAGRDLLITPEDAAGAQALYGGRGTTPDPIPAEDPRNGTVDDSSTLNGAGDSWTSQSVPVLAGSILTVTMTGTGDADLYVSFNESPNQFNWSCRPFRQGSNETCSLTVPNGATTAYAMAQSYTPGQSQFNITIEYTAPN